MALKRKIDAKIAAFKSKILAYCLCFGILASFMSRLELLAALLDWNLIESELLKYYTPGKGRKGYPIRFMAGLAILKYIDNLSDERVVQAWYENEQYRIFTGWVDNGKRPVCCHPSLLCKFRERIGIDGNEIITFSTIKLHLDFNIDVEDDLEVIIFDTTVQEKYTAFPTEAKLACDAVGKLHKIGKSCGIDMNRLDRDLKICKILRRNISLSPKKNSENVKALLLIKLKNIANRLYHFVKKQINKEGQIKYKETLEICNIAINQGKDGVPKLYSVHEPAVKCIAKGKPHKKYEFGSKVSVVIDAKSGIILMVMNHPDNPHDGKTLFPIIKKIKKFFPNAKIKCASCDRGYRQPFKTILGINIITPYSLKDPKLIDEDRKLYKYRINRRSSVEPAIGHMKQNHRLGRNYLHGTKGDQINLLLAAAGYNCRKFIKNVLHK